MSIVEKISSKNRVRSDSGGDGGVDDRAGVSIPMPKHTITPLKHPLWMRIIAKLPISPRIPDFLEKQFPALTGLVCYGYLPPLTIYGYVVATLCITVYFTFPMAHILLTLLFSYPCLVILKNQTIAEMRWREVQRRGFKWELGRFIEEYVELVKKENP